MTCLSSLTQSLYLVHIAITFGYSKQQESRSAVSVTDTPTEISLIASTSTDNSTTLIVSHLNYVSKMTTGSFAFISFTSPESLTFKILNQHQLLRLFTRLIFKLQQTL